ncbi:MAG TPA: inositol monophosphatase family protein [Chitinophagaceae bacterium]|nr:inositol monophosphatase [Chitinophagaceae bacterium]HQV05830.1 inositol monophosphatase family protein [Chitinophagaceae bacterium]
MLKETMIAAARAGAAEILRYCNRDFAIHNKEGINNLVTEADFAAEKAILGIIKEKFPAHQILAEESGEMIQDSTYKWIIDPIDGTVNFAHGIPLNCVSIGIENKGEIILAAVFNPHLNEFFMAEKGKGATLNSRPIHVSEEKKAIHACLVTGFPYIYINEPNGPLEMFERFVRKGVPVRRLGSAAIDLCWVAAGKLDGFFEHKLEPWDSAAGSLIVQEAGGKITDFKGENFSIYQHKVLATNGHIHDEMLGIINGQKDLQ